MNNYEAILKMDLEHLACFLDDIYVAGLNNGLYAASLDNEEKYDAVLEETPFSKEWLTQSAEEAVTHKPSTDEDDYILNASAAAVMRLAGIDKKDGEA